MAAAWWKRLCQDAGVERTIIAAIGKEPARISVQTPQRAEAFENRRRQRRTALLVALASDQEEPIDAVDGAEFDRHGLADAQAAGIHQHKTALVDRVPYAAKQAADLVIR